MVSFVIPQVALLVAGVGLACAAARTDTATPKTPSFDAMGFATVDAYGVSGLTGGGKGPVVDVHNARQFRDAVERRDIKKQSGQHLAPRVIRVAADIDLGELANERGGEELKAVGRVEVRSNTTIFASGEGAAVRHGILEVHGAHNVIIRNLRFRDLWEKDPTGKYDRYGWDYVRITSSGKTPSHHVWVDHCDFGKCYDGHLDITHGSDLVTVSWCRFSGDERGPHKKSMLIGHSSSSNAAALDQGRLNVTLHHNWFENIDDRAPRVRFGNIHAFNNFVDGAENATISVAHAVTLVENCVYQNTRIATTFSHASDSVARDRGGSLCLVNSRNLNPRPVNLNEPVEPEAEEPGDKESKPKSAVPGKEGKKQDPNREFETANNFRNSVERNALRFNRPANWNWPDRNKLPYSHTPDAVDDVPALVKQFAGSGKLREPNPAK